MPELDFQELGTGFRFRDVSPDSVIFTAESNFSMFSSASGSVERCSFASDGIDQVSVVSQNLAGHEFSEVLSGPPDPDPDPNKPTLVNKKSGSFSRKEKAKVQKLDSCDAETTEDEKIAVDSARNSFSQALKECQERRLRSEVVLRKIDRERPAFLDLNNTVANAINSSSPRFGVMKKPSASTQRTGMFPSPVTPNHWHSSVGIQKGWSSERIPLHNSTSRRNVNAALLPYNNGRALPSKWEDAERWIFSPMSGDSSVRTSFQHLHRRPKSKSGPLGPPGMAYHQMFSPAAPMFERGNCGKVIANSPFSAGAMSADGLSTRYGVSVDSQNFLSRTEPCMARSISIHGCAEMVNQSSLPGQQDDNYDGAEESANDISCAVSRKDMATQMSPESSINSSPGRISSFSLATPSTLPIVESHSMLSSRQETRDMPIDEHVTMTRWSKKSWIVCAETSKSISKIQREEAKIAAWENLQKAKAEAAMRKVEIKLEKKRSSSMDKIMRKLRSAQKKAQDMRSSMLTNQATYQIAKASDQTLSIRRTPHIGYFGGCFTCHAFWHLGIIKRQQESSQLF